MIKIGQNTKLQLIIKVKFGQKYYLLLGSVSI